MHVNISTVALLILLVLILVYYYKKENEYLTVKSNIDNRYYNILKLREHQNSTDIADLLSSVNHKTLEFLEYLKQKYRVNNTYSEEQAFDVNDYTNLAFNNQYTSVDGPKIPAGSPGNKLTQEVIRRILTRYNFEELYETEPTGASGTSYTINKGDKMYICVRQKETYELHDEEEILFVVFHELAHIGNVGWEHGPDFWEIFKFVLHEAELSGLFKNVNYRKEPIVYCGLPIDYNPYFDKNVKVIW